eukprot:scaffold64293_cov64-Attheya_sp.AAC.2
MMQVRAHIVNEADASRSCGSNPGRVLHTIVSYPDNGERWARLKCVWGRTFLAQSMRLVPVVRMLIAFFEMGGWLSREFQNTNYPPQTTTGSSYSNYATATTTTIGAAIARRKASSFQGRNHFLLHHHPHFKQ